ncbi:Serine/threonine protein kinase [Friedmanniella luteola]|uniref:non-specific serine/threonine protein kinase n=1 Tax=Friedmanniella luteola TaxID=546871 RepID=A0A1H1X4N0_9ACTN|nr:serine/threonine-protein kinase [Friedmanniella luteola]SDT04313.1 Serine/threonine protein kinase [Friedmanniella luteola]
MSEPQALVGDRYRLVEKVGSGGMGVVWEAWDERLERRVALKQLRTHAGVSEEEAELATQRAMREARITARLHHRHAVPVFDVVEHEGRPCLIMQFVPSVPLSAVLRDGGPLSPAEAARLGAEVASALAAAHQLGIVHRDVKPGNILVADDGEALISDFGISHALGDATLTSTGLLHGTPAYLAPEVARGTSASAASDVYSLGATLYAALEGEPPFGTDSNSIALLHRVAAGEYPPPRRSGALGPLLTRMLAREPDDRPTMRQVADELAATRGEPTAPADPVPPTLPLAAVGTPAPVAETTRVTVPAAAPLPATALPEPSPAPSPVVVPGGREVERRRRRGLLPVLLGLVALVAVVVLAVALLRPDPTGTATPDPQTSAATSPAGPAPSQDSASADPTPTAVSSPTPTPTPTPTRTPTPTPSPTPSRDGGAPTAGDLAAAIRTYYRLVPDDTDEAWPLLTGRYQSGTTGGRDAYENFWDGIEEVSVRSVRGTPPGGAEAVVTYTYDDDRVVRERTSFRLVEQGGVLKIDDSTVISSTG